MTDLIPTETITGRIFLIRDRKVILDRDLAELYGVQAKVPKQAVRRNIDRFPDDFMFEVKTEEFENLRSQIVTSRWGGTRYRPMAFTEQGVAMLSSVLKSPKAIQVNIAIMRAFVRLRAGLSNQAEVTDIERAVAGHDGAIGLLFEALKQLMAPEDENRRRIKRPLGSIGFIPAMAVQGCPMGNDRINHLAALQERRSGRTARAFPVAHPSPEPGPLPRPPASDPRHPTSDIRPPPSAFRHPTSDL